ncbi:MAG: thiamine pyrophosphate-dependent dehydrogenase E1 component subunit alpha [Candidatus Binataceae bacterium]
MEPEEFSGAHARAISDERKFELYRAMVLIRRFDERAAEHDLYDAAHASLYRGEEATAAGAILALGKGDYLVSAYREHGHRIAAGADAKIAMAYRRGKITPDAIRQSDTDLHFAGGAAITSNALAIAAGLALSIAYNEAHRGVCCMFGDEILAQGAFHEALNLASLWNLPIVFVCENNFQPMGTSVANAVCQEELYRLAAAYKMAGIRVDGMEVLEVNAATAQALERARSGAGPSLIEAVTYRPGEGLQGEHRIALDRDPIATIRRRIIDEDRGAGTRLDRIDHDIESLLDDAAAFAASLP